MTATPPPAPGPGPDTLAALHRVQLDMLLEFDRVCRLLGLHYQLAAGTLLGAVRHQGFIPWDDDVDVAMPRLDYDRLLREAPALFRPGHFLQHHGSDAGHRAGYAKLRRDGTYLREAADRRTKGHHGIFIDIFPFDRVVPDRWSGRAHLFACWLAGRLAPVLDPPPPCGEQAEQPLPGRRRRLLYILGGLCGRLYPPSVRHRLYDRLVRRQNGPPPDHVACLVSLPARWGRVASRVRPAEAFIPRHPLRFEGHDLPAPARFDSVLTQLYGDYSRMPPPDQQISPHRVIALTLPADDKGRPHDRCERPSVSGGPGGT